MFYTIGVRVHNPFRKLLAQTTAHQCLRLKPEQANTDCFLWKQEDIFDELLGSKAAAVGALKKNCEEPKKPAALS